MADIGGASIKVGLNIADLKTGVDKAKGEFNKFNKSIQDNAAKIKAAGLKVTAFGAVVTGVMTAAVISTAKWGDELGKTATKTGVSTEKLSLLKHAVELSGGAFENLKNGLLKLGRNMSDMSEGTGEAKKAFEFLGISVQNADGSLRKSDEVLLDVADKLSVMEDQTKAAALAEELFGRAGKELIPLLKSGSAGINNMTQSAADLGLEFSTKASKASEEFNDNLLRLKSGMGGMVDTIVQRFLPTLVNLTDKMVIVLKDVIGWVKENAGLVQTIVSITAAVGAFAAVLGPVIIAIPALSAALAFLAANPIVLAIAAFVALTAAIVANWDTIMGATNTAVDAIGATFDMFGGMINSWIGGIQSTIDHAQILFLKANIEVSKAIGENTDEMLNTLINLEMRVQRNSEESAFTQKKTWGDYYRQRQEQRTALVATEKDGIADVEKAEVDSAVKVADVRELSAEQIIAAAEKARENQTERWGEAQREAAAFEDMMLGDFTNWKNEETNVLHEFEEKSKTSSENIANKNKSIFSGVSIDWKRHMDSMANATANMVLNNEISFKSFGSIVKGVFNDIKNTVIGNFRQMLQEYVTGFIKGMLTSTNGLMSSITSGLKGVVSAVTGGTSAAVSGGTTAAAGGGGALAGAAGMVATGGLALAGLGGAGFLLSKLLGSGHEKLGAEDMAHALTADERRMGAMQAEIAKSNAEIMGRSQGGNSLSLGGVNVNVNGNVDDADRFATMISDRVAQSVYQRVSFAES